MQATASVCLGDGLTGRSQLFHHTGKNLLNHFISSTILLSSELPFRRIQFLAIPAGVTRNGSPLDRMDTGDLLKDSLNPGQTVGTAAKK